VGQTHAFYRAIPFSGMIRPQDTIKAVSAQQGFILYGWWDCVRHLKMLSVNDQSTDATIDIHYGEDGT